MSKENKDQNKWEVIKKSMTTNETRSMPNSNTDESPDSHLSPFEKIKKSKNNK